MDAYIYRCIRFILLLCCLLPSIVCFVFVFILLFKTQQITPKHLQHHFIFALLLVNFIFITTELPITLLYSYQGYAPLQSDQFCSFWIAYNYGIYVVGLYLMAFGSIERYFLVFHDGFVRRWRYFVHYPGILICIIYPLIFYSVTVNIYPCENAYFYDAYVCGGACFQFQAIIGTTDYIINAVTPPCLITLGNMILLIRVIKQKQTMKVANTWRKNRLMSIQLVSISILYFLIWIPFVTISLIRLFHDPFFLQDVTLLILNYCLYICPLASPFISLIGLPVVRQSLKRTIRHMIGITQATDNRIRPAIHVQPLHRSDEHVF